jgi:hypothetical protein
MHWSSVAFIIELGGGTMESFKIEFIVLMSFRRPCSEMRGKENNIH